MAITISETNRKQADAVLAILTLLMNDYRLERIDAEFRKDFYSNGREQGYVIELIRYKDRYLFKDRMWIAFSENRNSDSTVVYTDNGEWEYEITEKSYKNAKYFDFGKFYQCAEYIKKLMLDAVGKIEKEEMLKEENK